MRLLYLYLGRYGVLENKSLNFDTWVRFEYSSGCLRCIKNESSKGTGFFSGNARVGGIVDSISAIVGDNGTGKTTVARAIADLIHGKSLSSEFVAVVSLRNLVDDGEHYEVYYRLNRNNVLSFDNFSCPSENCFDLRNKQESFTLNQRLRLIYYSPLFVTERTMPVRQGEFVQEPHRYSGGDDLQVSQRITFAVRDVSATATISRAITEANRASPENAIILSEREKLLRFICDMSNNPNLEKSLDLPFDVDNNHAIFYFNAKLWQDRLQGVAIEDQRNRDALVHGAFDLWRDPDNYWGATFANMSPICLSKLPLRIFFYFAIEYLSSPWSSEVGRPEKFTEAANELANVAKVVAVHLGRQQHITGKDVDFVIDRIEDIENYDHRFAAVRCLMRTACTFENLAIQNDEDVSEVKISLKDRNSEEIKTYLKMMEYYLSCRGEDDFMIFTFENPPSAGEMSLLMMWARLYEVFSDSVHGKGGFKDVILFMDEAETALHPSWQRVLVDRAMRMWKTLANGCNVHMIFGSHSPVLLSDIPAGNIVWLSNENEIPSQLGSDFNTFGANIFDLYRLAFNQKNGTTGSFASTKIKEALAEVAEVVKSKISCRGTSNKPSELSDASQLTLSLIGDDIIRRYINGLKDGGLL